MVRIWAKTNDERDWNLNFIIIRVYVQFAYHSVFHDKILMLTPSRIIKMSGVSAMGEFKNRINVTINDQNYTIIGEENPEHIRYVAHLVDEKLKELGRKSTGLDTTRKSILTAVNIMHEKVKLEEENRKLLQEIKQLKERDE